MSKLKLVACALVSACALAGVASLPTFALSCPDGSMRTSADTLAECNTPESSGSDATSDLVSGIALVAKFLIGIGAVIAVVVIIIAGVSYTTSQGDSAKVSKATNAIIFSVLGLVVCLLAFAIVSFALDGIS